MTDIRSKIDEYLNALWRDNRDGISTRRKVYLKGILDAYITIEMISEIEKVGWMHRFQNECPGHDDEGGRSWCAYCGDMKEKL